MKKRILLIDDDIDMCALLTRFLTRNGYQTTEAHSGASGIEKYKWGEFDIVICDYRLGDKDGKEVLEAIINYDKEAIVLIITGYSDIETAVDVIKSGAYDYITKPIVPVEILNVLNTIVNDAASGSNHSPKSSKNINPYKNDEAFIAGESRQSKELYKQVEIVANTDYSVILYGESGTGKEVIARTIHNMSKRRNKPFIIIDCGTLSKELSGSELFGRVKGAFTGAINDKESQFELANGGTLFLNNVGNLSSEVQASLLSVIGLRKFKRIGSSQELPLNVRLVVASTENLQDACNEGSFREDLYHRFNEFSISLPALRQRKEDIPLFANFFLHKTKSDLGKSVQGFEKEVMDIFLNYAWPGNLRELKNIIRRASLLTDYHNISVKTLPGEIISAANPGMKSNDFEYTEIIKKNIFLKESTSKAEYENILKVLREVNFNKSKAAEILNIDRKTLYNRIRAYGGNRLSEGVKSN